MGDSARRGKSSARDILRAGQPPAQVVDLTGKTYFEWVEVRTDAGIVRVNVGLVTVRDGEPARSAVVVEIDRNYEDCGIRRTEAGGTWEAEVTRPLSGLHPAITLTRTS